MSDGPQGYSFLPYTSELPADPAARRRVAFFRTAAYILLIVIAVVLIVQFQHGTSKRQRAKEADAAVAKGTKGAIGRWRVAVRQFWQGENIYKYYPSAGASANGEDADSGGGSEGGVDAAGHVFLHPNMPFVVILLTPFAYLPVWAMALSYNLCKLLALAAAAIWIVRAVNDGRRRMPDWVVGLGLLWCILMVIGDIQHGNTNIFVLSAIALHLWLYRQGKDLWAGAALALAICLKMTPALFLLYWLYQRNWKLLLGCAAAMAIYVAGVPLACVGPARYAELMGTWWANLIQPGLLKGAWYPIHINQSLSGTLSRYFLDGANGNIFWNPDDNPYDHQNEFGWITVVALNPATVKWILRGCQLAVVALMAWAIGWKKLPRDDGRRGLHYALVVIGMMLLNQRTWDHHCAVLLVADIALWYAIAFSRVSSAARKWALGLMILAGPLNWLFSNGVFALAAILARKDSSTGEHWADVAHAYGPTTAMLLTLLVTSVILSVSLRGKDPAFADVRQKLSE